MPTLKVAQEIRQQKVTFLAYFHWFPFVDLKCAHFVDFVDLWGATTTHILIDAC